MPPVEVQFAEIIARGEAEDTYLICNRTSTSSIRVYHATFNDMYHFQLFWIFKGNFDYKSDWKCVWHFFNHF